MKTLSILILACLLGGCSAPLKKALIVSQSISGTGSVEVENLLGSAKVSVANARQEDGYYKADSIEIEARGNYPGVGSIRIVATDYARPVVKDEKEGADPL